MHFDIARQEVDTVLLDMDGTLSTSPSTTTSGKRWCLKLGPPAASICRRRKRPCAEYHAVQHTLNWYCLDYWSERPVWIFVR